MKSVLLGGLKVFLVNDGGKPLSAPGGRAKFYVAGTSTPEPVYADMDLATALGPVVYTDELGYLPAIWLKTDRLYKVQVEQKLPGTPETWAMLWEVDNVGYIDPAENEEPVVSTVSVSSIAALKAVDHSEHTKVIVSGYYADGDWGEPSMFVYDPESTLRADDGYIVRPNDVSAGDAGRWLQVFDGGLLDVRKFGALPDMTDNADVTAKVVNAVNYAQRNSTKSRPYTVAFVAPGKYEFAGDFDFTDYSDFVDLSDNSHHHINWFIGEDVVFKNENSAFTLSKNTVCMTRECLIEGDGVTLAVEGGGAIKVDPAWWGSEDCTLEDCYVECHSETTNTKSFTDCVIVSNGYLNGYVNLSGCGFEESWFVSGYNWLNMVIDNVLDITVYRCDSGDSYIDIMNKLMNHDYGDLGGRTVTGKSLFNVCTIENAVFDGVTLLGDAELRNVRGTFDVEDGAELTLVDCDLEVSDSVDIDVLNIHGGSIGRRHSDSEKITVRDTLNAKDCGINVNVLYYGDTLSMEGCEITKSFTQYDNSATMEGDIVSCTWHAAHVLDPTVSDTVVNVRWIGNVGIDGGYVTVNNASNLKSYDSQHGYVYENNTGSFPPMEEEHSLTVDSADVSMGTYSGSISAGKVNICKQNLSLESTGDYIQFLTGVEINPVSYNTYLFSLGCDVERFECEFSLFWKGTTGEYYDSTTHSGNTALTFSTWWMTLSHALPNDSVLAGYWKALMNLNQDETYGNVEMKIKMRRVR